MQMLWLTYDGVEGAAIQRISQNINRNQGNLKIEKDGGKVMITMAGEDKSFEKQRH